MLNTLDNNRIRKIRNKKVINKVSDVFSCLISPIENKEYKVVKVKQENPLALQQFFHLKELYEKGRLVKQKKLKKLVALYKLLNQEIPKQLEEYDTNKPKRNLRHRRIYNGTLEIGKKPRKLKRIPRKYNIYIQSHFWEERKNQYYQNHNRQCVICKSYNQITIHHLFYSSKEFGKEKDTDLVALCWKCHEEFHKEYDVKKNSHREFKEFCYNKVNNPIIS